MRKLVQGILDFRRHVLPAYGATFARLATDQTPDCLFIACSDSRVVPNLFASTQPGDLFVLRNVGNLVPSRGGDLPAESSVPAALEFAVQTLGVGDIVVCGHSSCGAMKGLLATPPRDMPGLCAWLGHGAEATRRLRTLGPLDADRPEHDQLSQHNVLVQLDHLREYPFVREAVAAGRLRLHAWWFEIGSADVYVFDEDENRFVVIDEEHAERMLAGDALREQAAQ